MKTAMLQEKIDQIILFLEKGKDLNFSGPIFEFGVYGGNSLSAITNYVIQNKLPNKIYGFDSFEGLPLSEGRWQKGDFTCSKEECEYSLMEICGQDWKNYLTLVPGWFDKSLKKNLVPIGKSPFIHIDSDLYTSCVIVLKFCKPYLSRGTFIAFDEWLDGEDKAWYEFSTKESILWKEISRTEQQLILQVQ